MNQALATIKQAQAGEELGLLWHSMLGLQQTASKSRPLQQGSSRLT